MRNRLISIILITVVLLIGCSPSNEIIEPNTNTIPSGMTPEEVDALKSIILLDDYPLYSMHFKGNYETENVDASESGFLRTRISGFDNEKCSKPSCLGLLIIRCFG